MKRIKRLISIFLLLFTLFVGFIKVNAATLSVSATASTTSTVVGNTITITIKFSSANQLGVIHYSMNYDSNYLSLTGGEQSNALVYKGSQKSDSVKFTFKAKKKGDTTVTFKINEALDFDGNALSASSVSKTINIKTQAEIEASYSKNNNLSSLSVNSGTLSPAFNKNTTEYSVTVENDVTKIAVSGSKEDSKSYVDGLKEYELEEGNNRIEVKVTAQNGTAKTYVINVTRKELSPINVKTEEGLDLTVVRKRELLNSPNNNYEETKITIDENDVPAFYNKVTDTYLVGLKNADGIISLYKYKDKKYTLYKELLFNSIIITDTPLKDIPSGYQKETIKIGDNEVVAYKDKENDYYLINGINIHTGEENLYQYDIKEGTIQRINKTLLTKLDDYSKKNNNYLYVIIGLGSLLIITYIVLLISSLRKDKKKNKTTIEINNEPKEKKKKKKDFDFGENNKSILDVETIEEIKNIENDNQEESEKAPTLQEKEDEKDIEEANDESLDNTSTLQVKKRKRRKDSKEIEKNNKKDDTI